MFKIKKTLHTNSTMKLVYLLILLVPVYTEPICHERVKPSGVLLEASRGDSFAHCLELCKSSKECDCFSFYHDIGGCVSLKDCNISTTRYASK